MLPALKDDVDQSSRTYPCDFFLAFAYEYARTQNSQMPSGKNASSVSSTFSVPTRPDTLKYKDPNLTGCYAGTGGSTIFTLTQTNDPIYTYRPPSLVYVTSEPLTFTFPCSEFLALGRVPWEVQRSFAESPACASYARDYVNSPLSELSELPPGVENGDAHNAYNCCGGCELSPELEVQLLHWPTQSVECSQANSTITRHVSLPSELGEIQTPAISSRSDALTFAIVDGSTLTFPSLYLAIRGAVSVRDHCAFRGKTYNNPTIALPPDGLSTLSFSDNGIQFNGYQPQTGMYDPAACRTYGISNLTTSLWLYYPAGDESGPSTWMTLSKYTMGPPYNPILLPPRQLRELDPAWAACTSWRNYGDDNYAWFFGLYDPPRILVPATAIVGPTVTMPDRNLPTASPPVPQAAGSKLPATPKLTTQPEVTADPASSKSHSSDLGAPENNLADIILRPFQQDPSMFVNGYDPAHSTPSSFEGVSSKHESDPQASYNLDQLALPAEITGKIASDDPNLHPIITHESPYHLTDPIIAPSSKISIISLHLGENSQPAITLDGKIYTPKASQYIIGSQTLSPGGSIIHVNGILFSLAASATSSPFNFADINFATILPIPQSDSAPLLIINGETYTPDAATEYIVAGSVTLIPGGAAITINNIPYAIPSPITALISGGHTLALDINTAHNTDIPRLSNLGSATALIESNNQPQIYTINANIHLTGYDSTHLVVGSTTLKPGSPPFTTLGYTLSLETGGAIVINGRTSTILTPPREASPPSATSSPTNFEMSGRPSGTIKSSGVGYHSIVGEDYKGDALNHVERPKTVLKWFLFVGSVCIAIF